MGNVNKKILFVSLITAILATSLLYYFIKADNKGNVKIANTEIYVAAKDIKELNQISENDLKMVKVPENTLGNNVVKNKDEIIGKYLTTNIYKDEQFIKSKLITKISEASELKIPDGKRAISIKIDETSAISYYLEAGDFVDVIGNYPEKGAFEENSQAILQDIEVLAVGIKNELIPKDKKSEYTKTAVLAVLPEDAEKLAYTDNFAKATLVLRQKGDHNGFNALGVKRSTFKP